MDKLKHIPILGFFIRYWMLLGFGWLAIAGCQNEAVFQKYGALIYIVGVPALTCIVALLLRHTFFRETLDKYISSGLFRQEWEQLTPWARQILACAYFGIFFVSVAMVAAAVAK